MTGLPSIKITETYGVVKGDKAINTLYNRGRFGKLKKGCLELSFIESAYLLESGRVSRARCGRSDMTVERILALAGKGAEKVFIAYSDIRDRGLYVSEGQNSMLDVWLRGTRPVDSPPTIQMLCSGEREAVDLLELRKQINRAEKMKLDLGLGVVDEEGDITYYKASMISLDDPESSFRPDPAGGRIRIDISGSIGISRDEGAIDMAEKYWLGRKWRHSVRYSLLEACYLEELGLADVFLDGKKVDDVAAFSSKVQPVFPLRYSVFKNLREWGYIVKTGFKYGTHFRCYRAHPDNEHALYLIQSIDASAPLTWEEVSRAVRLAHGVKKRMIFAFYPPEGNNIQYLTLRRIKM